MTEMFSLAAYTIFSIIFFCAYLGPFLSISVNTSQRFNVSMLLAFPIRFSSLTWYKGKWDRITNILDHVAIDEKCLRISFYFSLLVFFSKVLFEEGESQVIVKSQNHRVFLFEKS